MYMIKEYLKEKIEIMSFYFRKWLKLPIKDGKRRLVFNKKSNVWEWTSGEEPSFIEPEVDKKVINFLEQQSLIEDITDFKNKIKLVAPFEPKVNNRFIIEFPNVEPYFLHKYLYGGKFSSRKMSTGKVKIREISSVEMYLPVDVDNDLSVMKMSKLKNIGTISVNILTAVGDVVRTVSLKNAKIESVDIYSNLDYSNSDPMKATIVFSHDVREIS